MVVNLGRSWPAAQAAEGHSLGYFSGAVFERSNPHRGLTVQQGGIYQVSWCCSHLRQPSRSPMPLAAGALKKGARDGLFAVRFAPSLVLKNQVISISSSEDVNNDLFEIV